MTTAARRCPTCDTPRNHTVYFKRRRVVMMAALAFAAGAASLAVLVAVIGGLR